MRNYRSSGSFFDWKRVAFFVCGAGELAGVALAPPAIAVDSTGTIYFAESAEVWRISPDGIVTRVAGLPGTLGGYSGEGGPATQAVLEKIGGLAVNAKG